MARGNCRKKNTFGFTLFGFGTRYLLKIVREKQYKETEVKENENETLVKKTKAII